MDVFVFGDSHAHALFSEVDFCEVHWLGPITMHRVGRDGFDAMNLPGCGLHGGDIAVFVFGEIDVRVHIGRQCDEQGHSFSEEVARLASGYIQAILGLKTQFPNLQPVVSLVIPPTDKGSDPQYPFYGRLTERVMITDLLNTQLRALCARHNLLVLDVNTPFRAADGSLRPECSDGHVHVRSSFGPVVQQILVRRVAHLLGGARSFLSSDF